MNKRYLSGYFTFYQKVDGDFDVSFWRQKPNADCGKAFSARIESVPCLRYEWSELPDAMAELEKLAEVFHQDVEAGIRGDD